VSEPFDPNKKSFTQRMINALAEIDKLVGNGEASPLIALAPEVVLDRVRSFTRQVHALRAAAEAYSASATSPKETAE
jgi:hypothetical protein